jgi:integrase
MASIQWRTYPDGREVGQLVDHKNKHYKTLKGMTKTQAEDYLKVYEAKLLLGEAGVADKTMKYDEFKGEILDYYRKRSPTGEKGSTYQKYFYAFRSLETFSRPLLLSQVKVRTVDDWLVHARKDQGLGDTYVFMHYRTLKAAWNRAIKRRYINENPFKNADRPTVEKKLRRYLTDEEVDRLLVTARDCEVPDAELMVALFVGCGLRRQELTHLRWQDVNLDPGELHIKSWGDWTIKTHEERAVPVQQEVTAMLRLQRSQSTSDLVFPSPKGGGVRDEGALDRLFNKLYKRARVLGAKGVHVLRHTYGYRGAKSGDLTALQKVMGHKDIHTTMIYAHTDKEQARNLVNNMPKLNVGGQEQKTAAGLTIVS